MCNTNSSPVSLPPLKTLAYDTWAVGSSQGSRSPKSVPPEEASHRSAGEAPDPPSPRAGTHVPEHTPYYPPLEFVTAAVKLKKKPPKPPLQKPTPVEPPPHEVAHRYPRDIPGDKLTDHIIELGQARPPQSPERAQYLVQLLGDLNFDNHYQKAGQALEVLWADDIRWFAFEILRLCLKPCYDNRVELPDHILLFTMLLHRVNLREAVSNAVLVCIKETQALQERATKEVSKFRVIFKSLGLCLGSLMLGFGQPITFSQLDMENVLVDCVRKEEDSTMLPLFCKILHGSLIADVYNLQNPWTFSSILLVSKINEVSDLPIYLRFELHETTKKFGLQLEDFAKSKEVAATLGENTNLLQPNSYAIPSHEYSRLFLGVGRRIIGQQLTLNMTFGSNTRSLILKLLESTISEVAGELVSRIIHVSSLLTRELIEKDFKKLYDNKSKLNLARRMVSCLSGCLVFSEFRDTLETRLEHQSHEIVYQCTNKTVTYNHLLRQGQLFDGLINLGTSAVLKQVVKQAANGIPAYIDKDSREEVPIHTEISLLIMKNIRFFSNIEVELFRSISNDLSSPGAPKRMTVGGNASTRLYNTVESFAKGLAEMKQTHQTVAKGIFYSMNRFCPAVFGWKLLSGLPANAKVLRLLKKVPDVFNSGKLSIEELRHMCKTLHNTLFDDFKSIRKTFTEYHEDVWFFVHLELLIMFLTYIKGEYPKLCVDVGIILKNTNLSNDFLKFNIHFISTALRYKILDLVELDKALTELIVNSSSTRLNKHYNFLVVDFVINLLNRVLIKERSCAVEDFIQTLKGLEYVKWKGCNRTTTPFKEGVDVLFSGLRLRAAEHYETASWSDSTSASFIFNSPVSYSVMMGDHIFRSLTGSSSRDGQLFRQAQCYQHLELAAFVTLNGFYKETAQSFLEAEKSRALLNLFRNWVLIFNSKSKRHVSHVFLRELKNSGFLKNDTATKKFFFVTFEEALHKAREKGGMLETLPIEAFAELVIRIILHLSDERADVFNIFGIALSSIISQLYKEVEQHPKTFDQRPFFRIFKLLTLYTTGSSFYSSKLSSTQVGLIHDICSALYLTNPARIPQFSYSWLELVSNRCLVTYLLSPQNARGWSVFTSLIGSLFHLFSLYPRKSMPVHVFQLYKGVVCIFDMISHDFPDYFSEFYFDINSMIPSHCWELKNFVCATLPSSCERLPPYTHCQDDLTDCGELPKVRPSLLESLSFQINPLSFKLKLDTFLSRRDEHLLPKITSHLESLFSRPEESESGGFFLNCMDKKVVDAVILYIGVHILQKDRTRNIEASSGYHLLSHCMANNSREVCLVFVDSVIGHLRFPNSITFVFQAVLYLTFCKVRKELREVFGMEMLRPINVREPHPWGLIATLKRCYDVDPEVFKWASQKMGKSPGYNPEIYRHNAKKYGIPALLG